MADPVAPALKLPAEHEIALHQQLVNMGVPENVIMKAGGAGGFLSRLVTFAKNHPGIKTILTELVTAGIAAGS